MVKNLYALYCGFGLINIGCLFAATTTILGLIPLLQDVFLVNMSITIMAGLGFVTLLTMIVVPVLYTILFRIPAVLNE